MRSHRGLSRVRRIPDVTCDWRTVDEVDDKHGHRRWQICRVCGAERKQRNRENGWETVWIVNYNTAFSFLSSVLRRKMREKLSTNASPPPENGGIGDR